MTILDRARGSRRIRIDPGQFADDLAKRLPDLDQVDLGKARDSAESAISDAADMVSQSLDRAGEKVRSLRSDLGKSGESLVSRVERELPDTDTDRYVRAFERGRVQTRTRYVVVGAAAGILAGILGIVFLDPKQGKARRDALATKVSTTTKQVSKQVAAKAKFAQDRARGMAIERGIVKPDSDEPVPVMESIATPAWPSTEGPLDQPLDDPQFGAHEALPEDLVGAGRLTDNGAATDGTSRG